MGVWSVKNLRDISTRNSAESYASGAELILKQSAISAVLQRLNTMKEKIGTIKGIDLIKKSAPKADIAFRTGRHMTQKDRPRDKRYKKWQNGDW